MKNGNTPKPQTPPCLLLIAYAALAVTFAVLRPQLARADQVTPPPVPATLSVEAGHHAFLAGHAVGTQNYICLPSGSSVAWTLFGPQATLFNADDKQVITHFLSPNPDEQGTLRATWQHARDTSTIWAVAIQSSSDPAFVAPGAIPWLLLHVVGAHAGPTNGAKLSKTTFIQRLNTMGGAAPTDGCTSASDVGKRAFVPYEADYFFYKATTKRTHGGD